MKLIAVFVSLVLAASAAAQSEPKPVEIYNKAVGEWNSGRIAEAAETLTGLIEAYPEYLGAYRLYWDALGKTADQDAVRVHAAATLEWLKQMPASDRTERYYQVVKKAAGHIGDDALAARMLAEEIERFPRGDAAQSARLDAARNAKDPHEQHRLYSAYIEEFPENTSWVQIAARDRFLVIERAPKMFNAEQFRAAAERYDQAAADFVEVFKRPSRRVQALAYIGGAALARDTRMALDVAERASAFIRETAPNTQEFDESMCVSFDALAAAALADLGEWEACAERSALVLEHSGVDKPLSVLRWLPFEEAGVRAVYARALFEQAQAVEAHQQMAFAAALDPAFESERDQRRKTTPIAASDLELVNAKVAEMLDVRGITRKRDLLAKQQNRPAPGFTLKNLDGEDVSLADYEGKVVVLDFWATWCGPCIAELKEVSAMWEQYERHPLVEFVAVSIDARKDKVPPFVEEQGYEFEVLLGDGAIEADYLGGKGIPQLFVIDRQGAIRFHEIGFEADHFREHLEWMIEAAFAPPPAGSPGP